MPEINLNPDGPHSPDRTSEAGTLFDECSRFLTYATMSEKHGMEYPSDVYRLVADIYSAAGRLPQMCDQLGQFLGVQMDMRRLYEARNRDVPIQVSRAQSHLEDAASAARQLTAALQAVQADIAGLGVREDGDA
jgi:hypothetical protein